MRQFKKLLNIFLQKTAEYFSTDFFKLFQDTVNSKKQIIWYALQQ